VDTLIFWPSGPGVDEVDRFALEIVPEVRRAVGD